jgi:hypothetical protein
MPCADRDITTRPSRPTLLVRRRSRFWLEGSLLARGTGNAVNRSPFTAARHPICWDRCGSLSHKVRRTPACRTRTALPKNISGFPDDKSASQAPGDNRSQISTSSAAAAQTTQYSRYQELSVKSSVIIRSEAFKLSVIMTERAPRLPGTSDLSASPDWGSRGRYSTVLRVRISLCGATKTRSRLT